VTPTPTRTPSRTPTATIPLPFGPQILFFGIATADNHVIPPTETLADGTPLFDFPNDFGFIIVVEARAGTSRAQPAKCGIVGPGGGLTGQCPSGRSAVELLFSRPLGNGSPAVCDESPPNPGGVPAVPSLTFDNSQMVTDVINDIGCRMDFHATSDTACTFNALDNYSYVSSLATLQYCSSPVVGNEVAFPSGITMVKVQVQDSSNAGNVGNQAEIAIRVP
jgi:hypothetical protein